MARNLDRVKGAYGSAGGLARDLEAPLIGRAEELAFAVEVLHRSDKGGVVLAGPAGVGKTRLAREALGRVSREEARTHWLVGSRSAGSVPFGALAPLLPARPSESPSDAAALMRFVERTLKDQRGEGGMVVAVDDANLLDDPSAALVHQLASHGVASLLLTVRSEEHAPDAIARLWLEGTCTRLEVQPLSRSEVDELVSHLLGGEVEQRTLERLWRFTEGNVLFLRELLLDALATDDVRIEEGIWCWRGAVGAGPRLTEVIGARLGQLKGPVQELVAALAIGEVLGVASLQAWVGLAALAEAEAAGLIRVDTDGRRRPVGLAHPLYGEVVRSRLPAVVRLQITRRLANELERHGARRRGDVLRLGSWYLQTGDSSHPEILTAAADSARPLDNPLSIRLARAAFEGGGGFAAGLVLGWALDDGRDASGAETVARRLLADATTDGDRAKAAQLLADVLLFLTGRPDEAEHVLVEAQSALTDPARRAEVQAQRSQVLLNTGRTGGAVALGRAVLDLTDPPMIARLLAANACVVGSMVAGRTDEALDVLDRCDAIARASFDRYPIASDLLNLRPIVLLIAGRVREAEVAATELGVLADRTANEEARVWSALARGRALLLAGRIDAARHALREAVVAGRDNRLTDRFPWALGLLAEADSAAGNIAESVALAEEAAAWPDVHLRPYYPDLQRALAWVAAGGGEQSRARAMMLDAAAEARGREQFGVEVRPLYDALRLGAISECVPRLRELATIVDGRLAPAAAAHAAALQADDADALEQVADELAELGMVLAAAEALNAANQAYGRAGLRARARNAAARCDVLAEGCEGLRADWLPRDQTSSSLTTREREIAILAARGSTNRDIADRLVVSVRTVEGHLYRAYAKLGVSDRKQLAATLGVKSDNHRGNA
jgi:ATP/maltotriose-dependent transcriptional regulator MalT